MGSHRRKVTPTGLSIPEFKMKLAIFALVSVALAFPQDEPQQQEADRMIRYNAAGIAGAKKLQAEGGFAALSARRKQAMAARQQRQANYCRRRFGGKSMVCAKHADCQSGSCIKNWVGPPVYYVSCCKA